MLSNLVQESADMIVQAFIINVVRFGLVQYAPPISVDKVAIFIKSDQNEEWSWTIFVYPFAQDVWLVLWCVTLVSGVWLFCMNDFDYKHKWLLSLLLDFLAWTWSMLAVNFGRKPTKVPEKPRISSYIVLLSMLLSGTIIWMAYRASLTSELSVIKLKLPFDSLESLLTTDYRYYRVFFLGTVLFSATVAPKLLSGFTKTVWPLNPYTATFIVGHIIRIKPIKNSLKDKHFSKTICSIFGPKS